MCVVCFILRANVPTQVVRAVQLPGPLLQLLLRSQGACHHPVHTSIRPPARLSVTARSPTSPAKPFISGVVQVLASIWHTAHIGKHVKYRAAHCCIVCVCQCLFMGYGTLCLLGRLMAAKKPPTLPLYLCLCACLAFIYWQRNKTHNTTELQSQLRTNAAAVLCCYDIKSVQVQIRNTIPSKYNEISCLISLRVPL